MLPLWNHLHPAIVHFPIALLSVAPLVVLMGLVWPAQRRGIHTVALILLVLGFGGLLVALESGEAAERYARSTPALLAGLRDHAQLAQKTTLIFGLLGAGFALLWVLPLARKRELAWHIELSLLVFWLFLAAGGVLALARTGHAGGHLVHDLHTHAAAETSVP